MSSEGTTHTDQHALRKVAAPPAWAWALMAVVAAGLRVKDFFIPINRDSGLFAYGGWRVLHGALPYVDFWDNKLPGVFYVNAAAIRLFGADPAGLVVFQMLYAAVTVWLFFAVARRFVRFRCALGIALLFAFYYGSYGLSEGGNYTETYTSLPVLAAALLALKWSTARRVWGLPAAAGVLAGLAALIKQPAAAVLGAVLLYFVLAEPDRRGLAAAGAATAGAAAVGAATYLWMARAGILPAAVQANLVFNRLYFIDSYTYGLDAAKHLAVAALDVMALPLVGAVAGAAFAWRERRSDPTALRLLVGWFALDLVGVAMGGRFSDHYFLALLPSSMLLTGICLDRLVSSRRSATAAAAAAMLLFFGPIWHYESSGPRGYTISSTARQEARVVTWILTNRLGRGRMLPAEYAAIWVRGHSSPGDTIYVWGWETRVAFLAQREMCSRYLHTHPLGATGFDRDRRIRELANDIRERRPKYILDASPLLPTTAPPLGSADSPPSTAPFFRLDGYEPVKEAVRRYYEPVEKVDGIIIYGLRSAAQTSRANRADTGRLK